MERTGFSKVRTALGAAITAPVIMLAPYNDTQLPHGEPPVVITQNSPDIPTNPDVLISGRKWQKQNPSDPNPLTITYSFPDKPQPTSYMGVTFNTLPLGLKQRDVFRKMLEEFERVANIKFVEFGNEIVTNAEITNKDKPMISVMMTPEVYQINKIKDQKTNNEIEEKRILAAFATYPPRFPIESSSIEQVLSQNQTSGSVAKRSFAYYVMLHETAHNLGLKHPESAYPSVDALTMKPEHDSVETSIMSKGYIAKKSQVLHATKNIRREDGHAPSGLMPLDVAAVQKIYGANTSHHLPNDTHYFSDSNDTRTIWNGGKPYALDASKVKNTDDTDIKLDANPGRVSIVGNELMFNPLDAVVTTLRSNLNGFTEFVGSEKGTTRFEGGNDRNLYQFSGKNNHISNPAIVRKSTYVPTPGAEAVIEGFDASRDEVIFLYPKTSLANAYRDGQDMALELRMGHADTARLILKDFKGKAEAISIRQFMTADYNADLSKVFSASIPVSESIMPAWVHKALRKESEQRGR